jgi:two-component system response regulator YesN
VNINAADRILHDADGTIGSLMKIMIREYQNSHIGHMELLRCYLTQVLVHAVRASAAQEQKRKFHNVTTVIVEYLQQHYAEPLSLEILSHLVGYSAPYLSSMFHKDTGISLQTYQQKLRIEEACRLMAQADLKLMDISQTVGYSDIKHFSKVFRRWKGLSPKEFRSTLL